VRNQAFLKYGFLVFPDQQWSEEQNIAFGQRFGELEFGALPPSNRSKHKDRGWGDVLPIKTPRMRSNDGHNVGHEVWHTDSTYWPTSSKCAMLSAVMVPEVGVQLNLPICVRIMERLIRQRSSE